MKVEIGTFCDFAQESGGKLTIVGTFDTIISKTYPCTHQALSLVVRIRFDIWEFGRHKFRIETKELSGEHSFQTVAGEIDVKGIGNATAVTHLIFGLSNLRFKTPDVLNFVLFMDDHEICTVPLYLRQG